MNTRRARTTFLLGLSWVAVSGTTACAPPPSLDELVEATHPDFSIKDSLPLAASIADVFGDDIDTPTTLTADLDGNGLADYAVLLRNHAETESALVAYMQVSKNRFEAYEISRSRFAVDFIEVLPPQIPIEPFHGEELQARGGPIVLGYSAILGVNYAKSARVDYWDTASRGFRTIWTSD